VAVGRGVAVGVFAIVGVAEGCGLGVGETGSGLFVVMAVVWGKMNSRPQAERRNKTKINPINCLEYLFILGLSTNKDLR
jgi:hypothetical protein